MNDEIAQGLKFAIEHNLSKTEIKVIATIYGFKGTDVKVNRLAISEAIGITRQRINVILMQLKAKKLIIEQQAGILILAE